MCRDANSRYIVDRAMAASWTDGGEYIEAPDFITDALLAAFPFLSGVTDGCRCIPHWQDAGGGYTEFVLEYEPSCPEHSDHLYDPRTGEWVLRNQRETDDD